MLEEDAPYSAAAQNQEKPQVLLEGFQELQGVSSGAISASHDGICSSEDLTLFSTFYEPEKWLLAVLTFFNLLSF